MKKDYDEIRIEDLEVFANHGVFPEENVLGQKFLVSAVLYTDTRRAGLTDDLSASIHYGEVSAFIDRYLREHTFQLLERAASFNKDASGSATTFSSMFIMINLDAFHTLFAKLRLDSTLS